MSGLTLPNGKENMITLNEGMKLYMVLMIFFSGHSLTKGQPVNWGKIIHLLQAITSTNIPKNFPQK